MAFESIKPPKPVKPKGFFASHLKLRSQRIGVKDEMDVKDKRVFGPFSPPLPTVAPLIPLASESPTLLNDLESNLGPQVNPEAQDSTSVDTRRLNAAVCETLIVTDFLRGDLIRLQGDIQVKAAVLEAKCNAWRTCTTRLGPGRIGETLPLAYEGGMDILGAGLIGWLLSRPEMLGPRNRHGDCAPVSFATTFKQYRARLVVDFDYRKKYIGDAGQFLNHEESYQQGLELIQQVQNLGTEVDKITLDMTARVERINQLDHDLIRIVNPNLIDMPKSPIHGMGRVLGQRGKEVGESIRALHVLEIKARETARDEALEIYTSIRRELDRTVLATIKGHLLGATSFHAKELPSIFRRFAVLSLTRQVHPKLESASAVTAAVIPFVAIPSVAMTVPQIVPQRSRSTSVSTSVSSQPSLLSLAKSNSTAETSVNLSHKPSFSSYRAPTPPDNDKFYYTPGIQLTPATPIGIAV